MDFLHRAPFLIRSLSFPRGRPSDCDLSCLHVDLDVIRVHYQIRWLFAGRLAPFKYPFRLRFVFDDAVQDSFIALALAGFALSVQIKEEFLVETMALRSLCRE